MTDNRFPLRDCNALTRDADGVWSLGETPAAFAYSDGDAHEEYLRNTLSGVTDLSVDSRELQARIVDWPSEYHLSPKRANLLRAFDLSGVRNALELGCGAGAISRHLGERGIAVDAVEGSRRRAELARLRCRDLDQVRIVNANFNELTLPEKSYDAVLLIGVVEYAQRFLPGATSEREAALALLRKAQAAVKDDGVILIAIENRLGLKYLLGASEDHYGKPYVGLYGYPEPAGIRTYDRPEWEALLHEAGGGFEHRFCYPFPDYKVPDLILGDEYLRTQPFAYSNLYRVQSRDYLVELAPGIDEYLFWQTAQGAQLTGTFANSFLIVLSRSTAALARTGGFDFVHFSDTGRKPQYRVMTLKPAGVDTVEKRPLAPRDIASADGLAQSLETHPYRTGELLATLWCRDLSMHASGERFTALLQRYYDFLRQYATAGGEEATRTLIDLLPWNIVVERTGEFSVFDTEWRLPRPLTPEYVLFRSLLYFACTHQRLLGFLYRERQLRDVGQFIEYCFRRVGLELAPVLAGFIRQEDEFQGAIALQRVPDRTAQALRLQWDETPAPRLFKPQLYWDCDGAGYSEGERMSLCEAAGGDRHRLRFVLPPTARALRTLRFDPAAGAGFFHLYRVCLKVLTGSGERVLWQVQGGAEIASGARLGDVQFCRSAIGEVFVSTSDDPQLEFAVPAAAAAITEGRYVFEVEMDWPKSTDFVVARDAFIHEHEQLNERVRVLETELADKQKLERELVTIKRSRIWRSAEFLRTLFYVRLLGRIPLLQRLLLTVSQRGTRRVFALLRGALVRRSLNELREELVDLEDDYTHWLRRQRLTDADLAVRRERIPGFARRPKVSIVMPVHNAPRAWLERAIDSLRRQIYENWELCIVDDASTLAETRDFLYRLHHPRIKLRFLKQNRNIAGATNDAIAMASGEYIGFLDHDDELSVDALYEVVAAINADDPDFMYSDEDFIDLEGRRRSPHFKPDFSPDLLLSHNYVTHFLVLRRDLLDRTGPLDSSYDGAQDYDLVLRASELARGIHHIPKILYHWRMSPQSTSYASTIKPTAERNALRALESALARRGVRGAVERANLPHYFRVRREIAGTPRVSIIIPFKDQPRLLRQCIESILEKSTYPHYEIIGISNNSQSSETFALMQTLAQRDARVRFYEYNEPFVFSGIVNFGAGKARGEHLLLLNNDIEVISWDWLEAMLEHSQRAEVGAVGAKLYYPNDTVQHAGIIIGLGGYAAHSHKHFFANASGYFNRLNVIQNVSAVTGACLMVKKEIYDRVQGFDEPHLGVAYNDVDFCLRVRELGYLNVVTPYAELYHHESISRGYEDTPEKQQRFEREKAYFRTRHAAILERGDPYYNPNLTPDREDFGIRI